jgi:thioredoxin-related protein
MSNVKDKAIAAKNKDTLNKGSNRPNYYSKIQNIVNRTSASISSNKNVHGFDFNNDIPAFISLVPDSKHFSKDNIANSFSEPITNFLLNNYEERRNEKFQIFETFGNPSIFFFDKKVTAYSFSGYFVDSRHKNSNGKTSNSWAESFKIIWEDKLRGTKLIENNQIAIISFNGNVIWGYPASLTINNSAQAPFLAGFSFNMVVTKHKITRSVSKLKPITAFMDTDSRRLFDTNLERLKSTENKINELLNKYTSESEMNKDDRNALLVLQGRSVLYYNELIKIINTVKIYKNNLNGN